MEAQTNQLTPDQLYDQALTFFRTARWEEAIAALHQLQSQSSSYPEAESLLADIQLKQGMERRAQEPAAAAPPRERSGGRRGIALAAVGLVTLGLIGGLQALASNTPILPASLPVVSQQAVIGSLPTPAPSASADNGAAAASGEGVLTISSAVTGATVENIYFVFDASGSMLAKIDGRRKVDIAREAMGALVPDLSDGTNIALRTYGRNRPDDCSDIELLSPLSPLNRDDLLAQINAIEPVNLSRTPIGSTLAAIATDLNGVSAGTQVVLLSDGDETCDTDPVAEAQRLHEASPNVRVSVIGFDIDPERQARLEMIAEVGGGSYFGAADVNQLGAALRQALTLRYRVLDAQGVEVGNVEVGESLTLPVGNYRVLIGGDQPVLEQAVDIRRGMATLVMLSNQQGTLTAEVSRDWAP